MNMIDNRKEIKKENRLWIKIAVLIFWLGVWQFASSMTRLELLLPGPVRVAESLIDLIRTKAFYLTISSTFVRITAGFLFGFVLGILLGSIAGLYDLVRTFLSPLIHLMKVLPVVSFIILLLIWFGSANVAVWISFLVVFPMIYTAAVEGIHNLDLSLMEMAQVFELTVFRKIRYLYLPQLFPYVISGTTVALGMCWKAGISAEVIGLAKNSIGSQMYYTKLYLMTADLFAWSITVILISFLYEKMFVWLLKLLKRRLER